MVDVASLVMKVDALEVKVAAAETDRLSKSAVSAEKSAAALTATYVNINDILKRVAASYAAIKLVDYIKDSTVLAARYETLGISLHTAGHNAGYASQEMDAYQKALEKTGISMIESRNTLIQMSAANMDLANATKLARAAQDLAVVGNVNSSEAFNRLVYGIQSGQTEILRTLGLNVQFDESYKKLAVQLNKNVASLTEHEKMQARTNIAMEAASQYAGIYEAAMTTAGKQISSLARYHDNLQVVMGSTFTEALAMAVAAYTGELKDLNAEAQDLKVKGDLKEFGRVTALTLAVVADSARMAANAIIIAGASLAKLGLYAKIANKPWADSVAADKAAIAEFTEVQANAMAGMADNLKIYDAVSTGFAKIDGEDAKRKQKKLATDKQFASQALLIMDAYSNDTVTMKKKLTALGDVYGGDYAAQYGTRKPRSSDSAKDGKKKKIDTSYMENIGQETAAILKSADAMFRENEEIGKTTEQLTLLEIARIDEHIVVKEMEAARLSVIKGREAELFLVQEQINGFRALRKAREDKGVLLAAEKAAKEMADANEKEAKRAEQAWEKFTTNVQRNLGDVLYQGLNGNFKNIGDAFKQMLLRMSADAAAAQLTQAMFGGAAGGGALGGFGSTIAGFFGGTSPAAAQAPTAAFDAFAGTGYASFAGGGFTGAGSRSGGVDGMGGFPAILHPNETVIDHSKGQTAPSVTVVQNISIDSRSDQASIMSSMQQAAKMAENSIMSSLQRGGAFAQAVGRAA